MGKALGEILQAHFPYDGELKEEAREAVREWLQKVSLPRLDSEESTRQLLIALIDEPE